MANFFLKIGLCIRYVAIVGIALGLLMAFGLPLLLSFFIHNEELFGLQWVGIMVFSFSLPLGIVGSIMESVSRVTLKAKEETNVPQQDVPKVVSE
jgi:hypothetical protein